jgi:hypothetical protein
MDSHWIDIEIQQIKARDNQRAAEAHLRPHRAEMLQVKAPEFFDKVVEEIRAVAERLRQAFPDDDSRRFEFSHDGNAWMLTFHDQAVFITLDPSGQFVRIHPTTVHGVFHERAFELAIDGHAQVASYHTEPHTVDGLVKGILRPAFAALKR